MLKKLTMPSRPIRSLTAASAAIAASVVVLTATTNGATALAAGAKLKNNDLAAVAAAPGGTAWAVGSYAFSPTVGRSLIERWNGSSWRIVPSPAVGGSTASNSLIGVTAVSSSSAWAVGFVRTSTSNLSLILHWNGKSWRRVASPSPGGSSGTTYLYAVAAASASSAWAVGYYLPSPVDAYRTLILHWNGRTWRQVTSPNPTTSTSGSDFLTGVGAVSRSSAWAVGSYDVGRVRRTLALHWNGRTWKQVHSPNPGGTANDSSLSAVAVASASSVWAAGSYNNGHEYLTLIEHWNGKAWKRVASPNGTSTLNILNGVAARSPSAAFAVGYYGNGVTSQSLAEHWHGRAWKRDSSPSPGGIFGTTLLNAVAAASATSAWAVGYYEGSASRTLVVHWNGKAWKRVPSPNR